MTTQRRSFTPEFKREAADLVLTQNYRYIDARRSLGISESAFVALDALLEHFAYKRR